MMTGIIAAMDIEAQGLLSLMTEREDHRFGYLKFTSGKIDGRDVVIAVCGMGKVFAAMCTQAMIMNFHPGVVVNTGVAGTLTDRLHIGDVAVAEDLVQHDLDTSAIGNPVGFMPELGICNIPADKNVVSALKKAAGGCLSGTIASGDKFMSDGGEKLRLVQCFGAIACEMEGAAIAQVCFANSVPFGVLRAISDEADGGAAEDFGVFAAAAAKRTVDILRRFINDFS